MAKPKVTLYKDNEIFQEFSYAVGSAFNACALLKAFKPEHEWRVEIMEPLPPMPKPPAPPTPQYRHITKVSPEQERQIDEYLASLPEEDRERQAFYLGVKL